MLGSATTPVIAAALACFIGSLPAAQAPAQSSSIILPGGQAGIGFDDLQFSSSLDRVLVPAGRTGDLDLVEPATHAITTITGFSATGSFGGGHGEGITSVTEVGGFLATTDRTTLQLDIVDPRTRTRVARAKLASSPDYVRSVSSTHEIWVTEPGRERVEVFRFAAANPSALRHEAFISVPGGPESLVIDGTRARAYTHLWAGKTVAIDLKTRRIVGTWPNGCRASRGIALDAAKGWLFAGCGEGTATVLDVAHGGRLLGTQRTGAGVDIISYDPDLRHLYVPAATSATLSILAVSTDGHLSLVATDPVARGSHCVVADTHGNAYVCDPQRGALIVVHDPSEKR